MGHWRNLAQPQYFFKLHSMKDSIKQQNTFSTIATANVEVIASELATVVGVMNDTSIQTQVYRHVATTSS